MSDLVDDGLLNESLDLVAETTTVPAEPGRHQPERPGIDEIATVACGMQG